MRALRSQLPRRNRFYSFDPPKRGDKAPIPLPKDELELSLSRDPWKCENNIATGSACSTTTPPPPPKFAELELVVEPEPEEDNDPTTLEKDPQMKNLLEQYKKHAETEGEYTEEELPTEVIDSFEQGQSAAQVHFASFAARIARDPSQVLRYCFEPGAKPLCPAPFGDEPSTSSSAAGAAAAPPSPPPPCPRCGGPRQFEFQVMPQLLNHLGVDPSDPKAPDWGTIAVYCCAASCCGSGSGPGTVEGGYVEEYVWVQKPV